MYSLFVPKKLIKQFKDEAKEAFPKETLAYLCGDIDQTIITIEELWTPPNVLNYCTKDIIWIQPTWGVEAIEFAKENDLVICGDVHSHPVSYKYNYTVSHMPSEADILSRGLAWQQITGICVVREFKSGKLVASVKFWGPTVPLNVRIE